MQPRPSVNPIGEPLEARRLFAADLTVRVTAPLPADAIAEQKVRVNATVTVTNIGDTPAAGASTVELFLSADHDYDPSDVPLLTSPASLKLKPGAAKSLR